MDVADKLTVDYAYITLGDLAVTLKVDECRWASRDATMPCLRIDGTLRLPKDRLECWLAAREVEPPA